MENRVKVSAPGKLMLFGEHAVVYGFPCIVTAVDQRMRVNVSFNGKGKIIVRAPQVGLDVYHKQIGKLGEHYVPKPVRFIEVLVKNFNKKYGLKKGLDITTKCDFSSDFGFGSSAAVTVALAKALFEISKVGYKKKQLFNICYKSVLEVQGVGSGFDIAAAIYGGVLYFVGGGKEIKKIKAPRLPFVVGYTGVKADTPTLVRQVAELRRRETKRVSKIFENISEVVLEAVPALEKRKLDLLGELMRKNQQLLVKLGVSSVELDRLIEASYKSGALGAKLSGAGGGDCMIALHSVQGKLSISRAIEAAGGKVVKVELGGEGVRIE